MPKCKYPGCEKEATLSLKVRMFTLGGNVPAIAFLKLDVCSPEHQMPDADIELMLKNNWERICMGFDQLHKQRPDVRETKHEWRPIKEAEDFWKGMDPERTTTMRPN